MKVNLMFVISGLFLLVLSASASAGPFWEYNYIHPHSAQGLHSQDIYSDLLAQDIHPDIIMHVPYSLNDVPLLHIDSSQIAIAGIWSLQTLGEDVLQSTGQKSKELLIPLFAGSMLISLSGLLKKLSKPKPGVHRIKHQTDAQVSYEKMSPARS